MNVCKETHATKYKITYKGAKGHSYNPEWMVCPSCYNGKTCFGDKEQIISIIAVEN